VPGVRRVLHAEAAPAQFFNQSGDKDDQWDQQRGQGERVTEPFRCGGSERHASHVDDDLF
jgi:hypothetical protein